MFCPECGSNIGEELMNFCPECGAKVSDVFKDYAAPSNPPQQASAPVAVQEVKVSCWMSGVVLTNIPLLAQKLETSTSKLTDAIEAFIKGKVKCGVKYELIDVANYKFRMRSKQASLKGGEQVSTYLEILKDAYDYAVKQGDKKWRYLFIIGSTDIIPMPTIPHYKTGNFSDKDIDTDIIYGYAYGADLMEKLKSETIFHDPQIYAVGRLPVGEDTTMGEVKDYLERAVKHANGIAMKSAYGQCDPHWKKVSEQVTKDCQLNTWLRNLDGRLKSEVYYNRLMLTPYVDKDNVEQVFDSASTFYYYNLHGSAARSTSGYVGEYPPHQRKYATGITPQLMEACELPNVVMTESCYGARHIGLKKAESMVLSSIYGNTLVFLGSSRIAWGKVDSGQQEGAVKVSLADTMVLAFANTMLSARSAGVSLLRARQSVFNENRASAERAATLVEFNLFGDPTLSFAIAESKASNQDAVSNIAGGEPTKYKVECLSEKGSGVVNSLLSMVRREVDRSLAEIQHKVGDHLYKHYGLPPRPVSQVLLITAPDGSKVLQFDYAETDTGELSTYYSAVTSERGDVLEVISSK